MKKRKVRRKLMKLFDCVKLLITIYAFVAIPSILCDLAKADFAQCAVLIASIAWLGIFIYANRGIQYYIG